MAEIITINGLEYKKRSPWGAWLLVFPTIGIYALVWFYKVTKEAKQYLGDASINPGLMTFSQIIPIWGWYSDYRLGEHVGSMEQRAELQVTVQPMLGVVAAIVAGLHIVYYQNELNRVYDAALAAGLQAPGPTSATTLPPPPPPPPPGQVPPPPPEPGTTQG